MFLLDLLEATGVEFILDDTGEFATHISYDTKQNSILHTVMDLRDDEVTLIYYYGKSANNQKLNQQICQFSGLTPCYLSSPLLWKVSSQLSHITSVQYQFEQFKEIFKNPVTMSGTFAGEMAHQICDEYMTLYKGWFNIIEICGFTVEGAQGTMVFSSNGTIRIDTCRLSSLLSIVRALLNELKEKISTIHRKHIYHWKVDFHNKLLPLNANPIEILLEHPLENIEGFTQILTQGKKPLHLFGMVERVTPKLWSVMTTDLNTAEQLKLEVSLERIMIFLPHYNSMAILDKIESFLREHLCARFESTVL